MLPLTYFLFSFPYLVHFPFKVTIHKGKCWLQKLDQRFLLSLIRDEKDPPMENIGAHLLKAFSPGGIVSFSLLFYWNKEIAIISPQNVVFILVSPLNLLFNAFVVIMHVRGE